MNVFVGWGLVIAWGFVAAALGGGARAERRRLAVAASAVGALMPALVTEGHLGFRFMAGMQAALGVFRAIDLARFGGGMSFGHRLWHMFAIFDTRKAVRGEPSFEVRPVLRAAIWIAVAVFAFHAGMNVAPTLDGVARWIVRWLGAAVFAVAAVEVLAAALPVPYALLGWRIPSLHDAPYMSRSVAEFWGTRWNRVVGAWLRENCFTPFARRRSPRAGLAAAFAVSALLHWYLTYVSAGWWWSIPMAAFFLVQMALIAAERALGVARWPDPAARAWTLLVLIAVSPLFSEPMLALLPS